MVLFLIILLVISIPSNWLDWFVRLKDLNKDDNKLIRVFRMFLFHIGKLSNTSPSWAFSMFRLWAKQCWTGSGAFHANYSFRQRHLKTRLIYAVIFLKSEYTDSTFELVLWTCKSPYRRIRNERYSPAFLCSLRGHLCCDARADKASTEQEECFMYPHNSSFLPFGKRANRHASAVLNRSCRNRSFSKMAAENSNKLKLKTYTSTRKNTLTLVTLQIFSISGVISAKKMQVENCNIYRRLYVWG